MSINYWKNSLNKEFQFEYDSNGKKIKLSTWYDMDNNPREMTVNFANELKTGIEYWWYPNGKPRTLKTFTNGILNGEYSEWDVKTGVKHTIYFNNGTKIK